MDQIAPTGGQEDDVGLKAVELGIGVKDLLPIDAVVGLKDLHPAAHGKQGQFDGLRKLGRRKAAENGQLGLLPRFEMRFQLAIDAVQRLEGGEVAAGHECPLNDGRGLPSSAFGKQGPQLGKKFAKDLRLVIGRGSQVLLQGGERIYTMHGVK